VANRIEPNKIISKLGGSFSGDLDMADCHENVKKRIDALYNMLVEHDGYGEMHIDFKILKKGQKEVIIHCGKQYRYVVDVSKDFLRI
jgi:hypothetical protein